MNDRGMPKRLRCRAQTASRSRTSDRPHANLRDGFGNTGASRRQTPARDCVSILAISQNQRSECAAIGVGGLSTNGRSESGIWQPFLDLLLVSMPPRRTSNRMDRYDRHRDPDRFTCCIEVTSISRAKKPRPAHWLASRLFPARFIRLRPAGTPESARRAWLWREWLNARKQSA